MPTDRNGTIASVRVGLIFCLSEGTNKLSRQFLMDKLKPTPTLQTKVQRDGSAFEIYSYRKLTKGETDHEIALFIIAHRAFKPGRTYKIVSVIGSPGHEN